MRKCCIFAGGELENSGFASVSDDDLVICADSGLSHAHKLNIVPDLIIGDFDSYSGDLPKNIETIRCKPEKDDTDTLMAVKTAIERNCGEIVIYGCFGGRFDHTFANLQTLKFALERGVKAYLIDGRNTVFMVNKGYYEFEKNRKYFSVMSYDNELKIKKLSGVKYSLENVVETNSFPLGVSNEITAEKAVLEISDGTAVIIFSE